MTQIIIHRGTDTIGGSCIEINSNGSRIILDLGMPLMEKDGKEIAPDKLENPSIENGILPDVKGLYKDQSPGIDAVLISHAHIDHYGLLNFLHPSIPVYMSRGSQALINIGKIFYPDQSKIYFDNIRAFKHWKPFTVGPFKITSYLMDHSGYDASAYLIEIDGKKMFYSGDFRGHGRKSKVLDTLASHPIPDIDCLLMEGTTLGGNHFEGIGTEKDVEDKMKQIFSSQKDISFVMAAGSNIDRLVSMYNASVRCHKTLVLDLYTFYTLEQLKKLTPSLPPHPDKDNIRVYYIKGHKKSIDAHLDQEIYYRYKTRKIEIDEIVRHREHMVLKLPLSAMAQISESLIKEKSLEKAKFIFSMWSGYLEKDPRHLDFCDKYQIETVKIHTSGHAYLKDLERFVKALNPKSLIPIHTLKGENFKDHFDNVKRIKKNGHAFTL